MDLFESLNQRRSCRAFLPAAVEKKTIERLLQAANRSPSYMNSQPWEVLAVSGEPKERLARKLLERAMNQESSSPDLPFPTEWPDSLSRRINEHRLLRFEALGIDPSDQQKIREQFLGNFQFFGAPCVLIIGLEKSLTPWSIFDLGLFVHGLLLAAQAEGLGACPQAVPLSYPDVIRKELGIKEAVRLIIAVSLGYPDHKAQANRYQSKRKELNEFTRFFGW